MASLSELFRNHNLYPEFSQVKARLKSHNFICWVAGGAVRDFYLGRDVADFDLVTDAHTENLKQIFPEALLVGEKFGVLKLVLKNGNFFDLATFREESDYVDGRRPSLVKSSNPVQDAYRRDFTVNALFWDDENQRLVDGVGGVQDLDAGVLRAVGDARVRLSEDALRILRLLRFGAQLRFSFDPKTAVAARDLMPSVNGVSGERITAELKKITTLDEWNFILRHELFPLFVKEVFKSKFNFTQIHAAEGEVGHQVNNLHLAYFFSRLDLEAGGLKKLLSQKLKFSKDEMAQVEEFRNGVHSLSKLSPTELALELERKTSLGHVLNYLASQNLFQRQNLQQAQELLARDPLNLLLGIEVKNLLEEFGKGGPLIGEFLTKVRRAQFEGLIQTRAGALDFIRNQLSRKSIT